MSTYSAPAKVNLSLKVMGKREDGYHNVDLLMAKLDLADGKKQYEDGLAELEQAKADLAEGKQQ